MSRIDLLDAESACGDAVKAMTSSIGNMGVFRAIAHADGNILPIMRLGRAILTRQALDPRRRELVILLAMAIVGGEYEWVQHVEILLGVGGSDAEIVALAARDDEAGCFDEADRALLAFARQSVEATRIDDAVFDAARAHFSQRELVEAVVAASYYTMLAKVTEGFAVPLDPVQGMRVLEASR